MARRESNVTKNIIRALESVPRGFVRKIHGSRYQGAGLPDVYFTCEAMLGKSVWFEIKNEAGEVSEIQNHTIRRLTKAGAVALVVRHEDEVRRWLIERDLVPEPVAMKWKRLMGRRRSKAS